MSVRFVSRDSAKEPAHETQSLRSLNLLAHAQLLELDIGSRCGGFGECGGDRVRILHGADGLSAYTEAEYEHLTEAELKNGYRLACQCFPNRDDALIELETR